MEYAKGPHNWTLNYILPNQVDIHKKKSKFEDTYQNFLQQ